jgi:hypothetical protein
VLPALAPRLLLFQSTDCCIQGLSPGGGIYFLLTRVPPSSKRCIIARHPPNSTTEAARSPLLRLQNRCERVIGGKCYA